MTHTGLPDYESPPIVETILGVQFDPIERCSGPILGLFWSTIRHDWPNASEAPYLESKFERFGTHHSWSDLRFQLKEGHPPLRLQLRKDSADWMLQVQNSRLHINWIGYEVATNPSYPRYAAVREQFAAAWRQFCEFAAGEDLGNISPNQWEVTYINHIPIGTVWQKPSDWSFMQLLGDASVLDGLARFEAFQGGWRFALPNEAGRLHITWKSARRRHPEVPDSEQDIVILEQTARGPLADGSDSNEVLRGLDAGREVIVKSFKQLMDANSNHFWGYQA